MVFEFRQGSHVFTTFDKDLNFLEQKKSAAFDGRMLVAAAFSPKADLFTGYWMAMGTGGNAFVRNGVWTTDYEVKEQFFEAELFMFNPNEANKPSWWASYMAQWFALGPKQAVIVHDNKGRVYVADSQKYEVTRYNQKMEKELSFKKEYKPLPLSEAYASKMVESVREEVLAALPGPFHKFITDATVGKALELADFNPVKQPIFGMLPMEDHVLVFHDYDIDRGILTADIFDGQGAYLGTTKLPKVAYNYFGAYFASYVKMCFRDGKAYALVPDSDGELSLKRYAYELK